MASIDEQLRKNMILALRQVEMVRAQLDILTFQIIEAARSAGIQVIDPSQATQPAPQKAPEQKISR